jgi:uncharacterized membrane protein
VAEDNIENFEQRLARLEDAVAKISQRMQIPADEAPAPPAPAPKPRPVFTDPVVPPAPNRDRETLRAERFLGGRVLLGLGALTVLLGVGFFIKYAFDNGWIGLSGRVAIGLIAGIALMALGQRLKQTGQAVFAGAMTGLGGAVLYLSIWGAGNGFHLMPLTVSFSAMAVVTAALIVLAVRNESRVTASFALIGGFLTPLLNSTQTPQILELFIYLVILDSVFVFAPVERRWPALQISAFAFTQLYVLVAVESQRGDPLALYLAFGTIFLAIFLAQPVRKALAGIKITPPELLLTLLATGAFYALLHRELFIEHRHWLTAVVVVLAAAFVLLAQKTHSSDRNVFAAIGIALITGGVAITFTGDIVAILWMVEGALLVWMGLRARLSIVRAFGYLGLLLATATIAAYPPLAGAAFLNERFLTFVIFAIALFAVRAATLRYADVLSDQETYLGVASEPLAHCALLYAVSTELYDASRFNELSLTLFWLVYAAALLAYGLLRTRPLARWEAFALLLLAILKAFTVDMAALNPGIRIVSFLALGTAMLVISYIYQRYAKPAPQTP